MLYAFPADRTGCGFYRVVWPLTEIRDRVPVTVVYPGEDAPLLADLDRKPDKFGRVIPSVKAIEIPDDCSAVLLQRPISVLLVQCIPFLKAAGIRVIVEIDDDLHALTPRHAAYKAFNKTPNPFEPEPLDNSLSALMQACSLADLVICSTPALVDRYAPGSGVVLRNRLRSDWRSCLKKNFPPVRTAPPLTAPRVSAVNKAHVDFQSVPFIDKLNAEFNQPVPVVDDALRIGWGGVITTHPDDLQVLSRALPRVPAVNSHGFIIVGPVPDESHGGIKRARTLLGINNVLFTGSVPFADWLPHLATSLDIGLAPLEDNRFNAAKSWLKPLEYAACGIPCVVQDTKEYRLLGAGAPASDHKDYLRQLGVLLRSPSAREDMICRNYLIADENTYANFADEWYASISPYVEGCT